MFDFTDRKGITDTATVNFVVTNDRKRRNLGWNNRRFWSRNIIIIRESYVWNGNRAPDFIPKSLL